MKLFIKRRVFSKRLVFAYASIIISSLAIFFVFLINYINVKQKKELKNQCYIAAEDNYNSVLSNLDLFNRIEFMVESNSDLMLFLMVPDKSNESEIITTTNTEATTIERILSVMPSVYSVRVFTNSNLIPERWPVILHKDRVDFSSIKEWEYNYSAIFMGFQDGLKNLSVCMTREIKNKRPSGFIQVSMKMENFFPFLFSTSFKYQNDYIFKIEGENKNKLTPISNNIIDQIQGTISDEKLYCLENIILSDLNNQNSVEQKDCSKLKSIITWSYIEELDLMLVHTCSTKGLTTDITIISIHLIFVLLISAMFLYFVIEKTTSRMVQGVYSIMNGMNQVAKGNFNVTLKTIENDEVGDAQKAFNKMTMQLRNLIYQIKKEHQLIAETELKAMQNQINAHFLYNVLETIRMQAILADQDDISESITVLGKMMRYCLRWRVHTVTIEQEIEYISSYIYILNIRNDYTITLQNDIDSHIYGLKIPKMIIQPFVENSFIHAIEPDAQDSVIRLYTETTKINDKDVILLCIQDFGKGITEDKLKLLNEYINNDTYEKETTGNIGVKNIQQRLNMFYGKDFKIHIISEIGKGTIVKVPIPIQDN